MGANGNPAGCNEFAERDSANVVFDVVRESTTQLSSDELSKLRFDNIVLDFVLSLGSG